MLKSFTTSGRVSKFPGKGGWFYLSVPKKYTKTLKEQRRAWGSYPIIAKINKTSWETKLMTKKGGDFFVALKSTIRTKEKIKKGDKIKIDIKIN